jgi:hypothetical protein
LVKNEAAAAVERGILVPVIIDRVRLPLEFRRKQTADLVDWRGDPAEPEFLAVWRAVIANAGKAPDSRPNSTSWVNSSIGLIARRKGMIAGVFTAVAVAALLAYAALYSSGPIPPQPAARVADVFVHPAGSVERQGELWVEYPQYAPGRNFKFKEARREGEFIYLYDETRHKENDPARIMYLRIPISGGMAQWSFPNPFVWQDLYPVTPKQR